MGYKEQYTPLVVAMAEKYGLPPELFLAQIQQESGFNPKAVSSAGAKGIAQIVPKYHPGVDPMNPTKALDYAAKLMASNLKKYGSYDYALAAYNGGPGAVQYFKKHGGIFYDPKAPSNAWKNQTGHYVQTIMGGLKDTLKKNTIGRGRGLLMGNRGPYDRNTAPLPPQLPNFNPGEILTHPTQTPMNMPINRHEPQKTQSLIDGQWFTPEQWGMFEQGKVPEYMKLRKKKSTGWLNNNLVGDFVNPFENIG